MIELRHQYPLASLLRFAGLARSTFYYQKAALRTVDKYASAKNQIKAIYDQHKGRYGYRRITATLRRQGAVVNHKTVQRLMGELQLKSIIRVKKYRSYRGQLGRFAPNLLERDFHASQSNEKWVTDVTEFNVDGRKLYRSPLMDLFNGEILAYSMSRRPLYPMIGAMLNKAFACLAPEDRPVLHSDQGWQYQMEKYRLQLSANFVSPSMSRKGNCLDNAAMESSFGTLKSEYFHLNKFSSLEELEAGLRCYIRYYNRGPNPAEVKRAQPNRTSPTLRLELSTNCLTFWGQFTPRAHYRLEHRLIPDGFASRLSSTAAEVMNIRRLLIHKRRTKQNPAE